MGLPEVRTTPQKLGRYELITLIGKGGMAEVHLAMQRGPAGFEKLVVVKVVHEHLATQKAFVDMLLDEGRLAGMIKHPNVVDIYDLGEANGRYFVAMEYLDGEPLLAILRAGSEGERLDPLSTARVIADTAEGLEAAHRLKGRDGKPLGVVHHDVSLGNIVVLYTGVVKLVDFGVAKARSAGKQDRIQGKFSYMAPEKLLEGTEVDRRSDIWSLGVVAWEALTLSRLFKGEDDAATVRQVLELPIQPPSEVNPEVPPFFDAIVMKALERDVTKRYSTAKAFALDLEDVLRKRGYAGKNEQITKYMEQTFARQIAARERLLEDLASGQTSPEVIQAFKEAATQTISTTDSGDRAQRDDDLPVRRSDPSWAVSSRAENLRSLQSWVDKERRKREQRIPTIGLAIGGALLLLIIVLAARGGGDDDAPTPPPITNTSEPTGAGDLHRPLIEPPPTREPPPTLPVDAVVVVSIDAAVIEPPVDVAPDDIEMDPVIAPTKPKPSKRPPPPPKGNPETLYTQGLDAFRKREYKQALAAWTAATRASPNYAPAWFGLGLANEALGNRGAAKASYLRYLSLAPRAANASDVRAKLERL